MTEGQPMNVSRTQLRKIASAFIAGFGLITLASCGGGGGGGGGGGNPESTTSTMQITPNRAPPGSLSLAQVAELPGEGSFSATLTHDDEDQTLVYGFSLDAGNLFGTEVTAESGQNRVAVSFYSQNGEEITALPLPGGGVGFEAPSAGNYFMAISAAPSGVSGRSHGDRGPRAVIVIPIVLGIKWAAITSGTLVALKAAVVAGSALLVARRLSEVERADLEVRSPTVNCPQTPVRAGDRCTLQVRVANKGGRIAGVAQGAYSDPPILTYYRSTDSDISSGDMAVGMEPFERIVSVISSATGLSVPHSTRISAPEISGTYYYGACVDPIFLEKGTGLSRGPLSDLTGNNCSDGALMVVEEGPPQSLGVLRILSVLDGEIAPVTWALINDEDYIYRKKSGRTFGATGGTFFYNAEPFSDDLIDWNRDGTTVQEAFAGVDGRIRLILSCDIRQHECEDPNGVRNYLSYDLGVISGFGRWHSTQEEMAWISTLGSFHEFRGLGIQEVEVDGQGRVILTLPFSIEFIGRHRCPPPDLFTANHTTTISLGSDFSLTIILDVQSNLSEREIGQYYLETGNCIVPGNRGDRRNG